MKLRTFQSLFGYAAGHNARNSVSANSRTREMCSNEQLELFLERTKEWMDMNQLKINMSKTEFIRFGDQRQLDKCITISLSCGSETIDQVDCVKNLGVLMDRMLLYSKHINKKYAIAYQNLMNIRQLRGNLNEQNATQLILALVISHLDFFNSLLTGLPKKVYKVMQRVKNISAKLILKRDMEDSLMNSLKKLYQLPVEYHVQYKILKITHKCIYGNVPAYRKKKVMLVDCNNRYSLRSNDSQKLVVPKTKCVTYGDRSFSFNATKYWNMLPHELQEQSSLNILKKQLKTYLFEEAHCC